MQAHAEIVDQFLQELGFKIWHHIAYIFSCLAGSAFFLLGDRIAFGWSMLLVLAVMAGILPMIIRYNRTFQSGQFELVRQSGALSLTCFWRAVVPSKTLRRDHPWLLPLWIISFAGFDVSMLVTVVRLALAGDSPSN